MTPFNKYIPTTEDNYLGYSKGVEAPKPNLALAKLFSGLGEMTDMGIKGGTDLLDIKIENEAEKASKGLNADVSGLSLDDAATLGRLKNKVDTGVGSSVEGSTEAVGSPLVSSTQGAATLLAQDTQNAPVTPVEVQKGLSTLDKLYQKYQHGDLSPTYWMTRQQAVVQQLKARFPGSEQQIDQAIHRNTQSANQIRNQLFSDFQAAATLANSANKQWDSWVDKNSKYLGDQGIIAARDPAVYGNRAIQTAIMANVARQERIDYDRKTQEEIVNAKRANNALVSEDSEHAFLKIGQGELSKMLIGADSPLGGLQQKIDAALANPSKIDPNFLAATKIGLNQIRSAAEAKVTELETKYGPDIRDPNKIAAIKKQLFEPLDRVEKSLGMGDLTAANFHADIAKRQTEMDQATLLQIDPVARWMAANKGIADQNFISTMIQKWNVPTYDPKTGKQTGSESALARFWRDSNTIFFGNMAGKVNPNVKISEISQPKENAPGVNKEVPPAVIKQNINQLGTILTTPEVSNQMKSNAVDYITNDKEGNFFKSLDKTSQLQAFNTLTAPDIIKSVSALGPDTFTKYSDWATNIATSSIGARVGDIRTMVEHDQLKYNPETNQLDYVAPPAGPVYPEKQSVDQINNSLRNLKSMYDLNKTDIGQKFAPMFQKLGVPVIQPTTGTGKRSETPTEQPQQAAYAPLPKERPSEASQAIKTAIEPKGIDAILKANLEPGKPNEHITGMAQPLKVGLAEMIQNAPPGIKEGIEIFSGHRSIERQRELFNAAVEKYGSVAAARRWVAPPGHSMHNAGFAADLRFASAEVRNWVHQNARKFDLHFPLSNEPWHIEHISARGG